MKEDPILFFLYFNNTILNGEISFGIVVSLIVIFFLILLSALISGSEVAFFSLNLKNLKILFEEDRQKERSIRSLLRNPNKLLATILIANNFVNVAIIVLSFYVTSQIFNFSNAPVIQFIVQVLVITIILVLLGEITPKVYAKQHAVRFSKNMVVMINILQKIFSPISLVLLSFTNIIDKRMKQKSNNISMQEISQAIDLTKDGVESEDDKRILRSIIEFGNTDVKEIMKPRTDVIALEINTHYKEVLDLIVSTSYSRIPVFEDSFDKIKGVLYIKDLIPYLSKENVEWKELCHDAFFVPETKKINDLLKEFQKKKIHLAIVVDEYGGTSGIVTLEDVLEEIVGEINDEFDDDGKQYSRLDQSNFVFEGKISLNDFLKIVGGEPDYFDNIKLDAETIAGLILEQTGKLPKISEEIDVLSYTFRIESVDDRRIKRVKVKIQN